MIAADISLTHRATPISPVWSNVRGFTLIELLVAMVIFAMLALSGWQIMDSISRSRDRANVQLNQLSELQYAYVQLSQDFAQTVNYVSVPAGITTAPMGSTVGSGLGQAQPGMTPTFVLTSNQISMTRLASPDPRLNPPPVLARVVYLVDNGNLVKQRFYQLNNPNETPATSVLLTGIKDATWSALTPEPVSAFPDAQTVQAAQTQQHPTLPNASVSAQIDLTPYRQLPKGVQLNFTYHDEPMVWRFALPEQAPSFVVQPTNSSASAPNTPNNPNTPNTNGQNSSNGTTQPPTNTTTNPAPNTDTADGTAPRQGRDD
jgi:general secretion pathway protein J